MDLSIIAIIIAVTTIILSISATVVYSKKTISLQNDYNAKIDALNKTIDVNKSSTQRTNSQIQDKINAYSLSFSTSNLSAPKISSENITSSNITSKSINGINAYFSGLLSTPLINSENITASELRSSRLTSSEINSQIVNSSNINSKLVTSENFSGNLTGTRGTFSRISASNAVFTEASGVSGNFTNLIGNQGTFAKLTINNTVFGEASGNSGTFSNLNGINGTFSRISASNGVFSEASGVSGNFTNLTGNQGTFSKITASNAVFNEASVKLGTFSNLTGTQGTFTNISGNLMTDEINDAPGGPMLSFNKNNQNVVGNEGVAIYNGAAIINGGGLSVGNPSKVPEGQVKIRDQLTIGNNTITTIEASFAKASFGGPDLLSSFPASDGNTYIRPGKLSGSVYINDKGTDTYLGGIGSLYANNSIMFTNSSPMIQKQFNNAQNDRYGISLSNNVQRIYAGTKNPSSVNVSFANNTGSYNDIISVSNSGMTQINGPMSINNAALSNNLLYLRSYGDSNNILSYATDNANFGITRSFSNRSMNNTNIDIDGPVLTGCAGGILGTRCRGDKSVLTWNSTITSNYVQINGNLTTQGLIKTNNSINTPMLVTENAFINQNLQIQQDVMIGGKILTNDGTLKVCDSSGNNCKSVVLQ